MGSDGVRVSPAGPRLSFRFNVHGDDPQRVATGQYMAEWAAEAGVELNVQPVSEVGSLLDAGTYDLLTTGWSVNPDPDFIMSINLCSGLPAAQGEPYLSDAYFCDPRYDELYQQQLAEFDLERRVEIIHEMQQMLYESGIFVVLGYPDQLEAYRSDQIASIQTQPDPGGNIFGQDGHWSWWSAVPATDAEESGGGAGMAIGIAAAVVIVLGVGAFLLLRRRSVLAEERE